MFLNQTLYLLSGVGVICIVYVIGLLLIAISKFAPRPRWYWLKIYMALMTLYPSKDDDRRGTLRYSDDVMEVVLYPNNKLTVTLLNYPTTDQSTIVLSLPFGEKPSIYRPQGKEQWEKYLIKTLVPKINQDARTLMRQRRSENYSPLP